jgi:hypothetical protein
MPKLRAVIFIVFFGLTACSAEQVVPECPAESPAMKTTVLQKPDRDGDWCRACVMGAKWASCQTARAENMIVKRDVLQARALERACQDAGFEKDKCPATAILSTICRGDKKPSGSTPSKALQKAFFDNLKKEGKSAK